MKDNFIHLKERDTLKLGIKTEDGTDTGEFLEFDFEDIELPLRYQEMVEQDKKNLQWIRNQMLIIDKRQDVKGKKLMSKNEEDKIKALNDFFKKEEEIFNMFLGEGGVKKLLNGKKFGWTSIQEIIELIEAYILPHFDFSIDKVSKKIKEKYKISEDSEKEVLK